MTGDWLFLQVDDTVVGLGLLAIALVTAVWGVALLMDAFANDCRVEPRWHPRCWVVPTFGYWLGLFLVVSDAGIYAILGAQVLRGAGGTDLWAFVYVAACTALAVAAFVSWARERAGR